jgi:hypothetical protein
MKTPSAFLLAADGAEMIRGCDSPGAPGGVEFLQAAAGDGADKKLPKLRIAAYNGGPMTVGYYGRVVVDLAGLEIPDGPIPVLQNHDITRIVGHGPASSDGRRITIEGEASGSSEAAREVVESGRNGFPWKASIGLNPLRSEEVESGASVTVNGREVEGPVTVIRQGRLKEVSVVPLGADMTTKTQVAAHAAEEDSMDPKFAAWLKANGHDAASLTAERLAGLKAEYEKETAKAAEAAKLAAAAPAPVQAAATAVAVEPKKIVDDALKAERTRIAAIEATCAGDWDGETGKKVSEIRASAIREGESVESVNGKLVAVIRESRPNVGHIGIHIHADDSTPQALEAALAMSSQKVSEKTLLADYGEKVLTAARRNFHGLRLREFIAACCAMDGVELPGTFGTGAAWLKAAFSSNSLPGILGNVANKTMLDAYRGLPGVARQLARVSSVNDFKVHTRYRMGADMEFELVGAGGELAHGELSEQSFTQQAKTYGKYFALTRQDIVNDDLGAFLQIPQLIGRGAAQALEKAFWTIVLANASSFWGTDNANYLSGGTSPLAGSSLTLAVALFENFTDPHGQPIVCFPKFLVVSPALRATAERLFTSEKLITTGLSGSSAVTTLEDANIHRSRYQPLSSPYISNAAMTGHSSTAWFLWGDPADVAAAEIAFLNGQDAPVIEAVEVASDSAGGKGFRAYHDFGVALMDPKGAVMSAGA